jgi:hypothetical protein
MSRNEKNLDDLDKILTNNPDLGSEPYPSAQDPEYTYSHELTRLVARKLLFSQINGSH